MSGGVLPPVPDLIPITALQGQSMGEQRPCRRAPAELIDTAAGSRASSATPPPPPLSSPARPGHRRRKSDRRRGQRKTDSVRSVSKQSSLSRSLSPALEKPPRVNPIFVWIRQDNTRIVDVKCEDYDKRNRILLTKTAHGWKAIPRTETLVPTSKTSSNEDSITHHHHHRRRNHKHKSRRKSISSQFPENLDTKVIPTASKDTTWMHSHNVNIESLLPSHTIQIKRVDSPEGQYDNDVNRDVSNLGHAPPECSAPDKVCDVSPLENLLAVAELEFKQQMESGIWKNEPESRTPEKESSFTSTLESDKNKIDTDFRLLSNNNDNSLKQSQILDDINLEESEDYNEDDDGISMNDILSRLEKSLESPKTCDLQQDDNVHLSEEPSKSNPFPLSDVILPKNDDSKELFSLLDSNSMSPKYQTTNKSCEETTLVQATILENEQNLGKLPKELIKENNMDALCVLDQNISVIDSQELSAVSPETLNLGDECNNKLPINLGSKRKISSQDHEELTTNISDSKPVLPSKNCEKNAIVSKTERPRNSPQNLSTISSELIGCQKSEQDYGSGQTLAKEDNKITDLSTKCNSQENEINLDKNNSMTEGSACSPVTENNILEILSKEVEKIDPIILKTTSNKNDQPQPIDFSIKDKTTLLTIDTNVDLDRPTDLTMKKNDKNSAKEEKRPSSQNSEAVQSPQPSGIPAILHSPDTVSSTLPSTKNKSIFLESLLANSSNKMSFSSELTITKKSGPMDIESRRKSASPTVTCSEEIINKLVSFEEPPNKKIKSDDIVLKTLLEKEESSSQDSEAPSSLLKILKETPEKVDPLTDFKKLLLEIEFPEPLMVPKDKFVDLLKNPRKEIFNLLNEDSYKNLKIDDILVVYKDKLFAALEANAKLEKTISESKPNQILGKSDMLVKNPNKKKSLENTSKITEVAAKNISASDIDAATEAAFSQMMMLPYQNQFDAMNWANCQQELLQALYSSNPFLNSQASDLHPSLQLMLGNNRIPHLSPLGFPPFSPMNMNNHLEFSMWQEAMLQASMLRNKNTFETSILTQPVREFKSHIPPRRHSSNHPHSGSFRNSHKNSSQPLEEQRLLQKLYEQNNVSGQQNYHNPYLGQESLSQRSAALNVPHYSPYQSKNLSNKFAHNQSKESNLMDSYREHERLLQQQFLERQKVQKLQKERLQERSHKPIIKPTFSSIKPFPLNSFATPKSVQQHYDLQLNELSMRQSGYQAMDLSGAHGGSTKLGLGITNTNQKQEKSCTPKTTPSKPQDDVAEVGSTTASIEEMQDANTHLWHPLFGSDKGYSQWNIPTSSVAASPE